MNRAEAINYLESSGFSEEQIRTIEHAYTCEDAISRQAETGQFAKWVATEIFDDMWEYNKDAFAELACRKLAKLGIVRAKGDKWELVEPQESEDTDEDSD